MKLAIGDVTLKGAINLVYYHLDQTLPTKLFFIIVNCLDAMKKKKSHYLIDFLSQLKSSVLKIYQVFQYLFQQIFDFFSMSGSLYVGKGC